MKGLFEAAHRGTIFLDEVADLLAGAGQNSTRTGDSEIQKVGSAQTVSMSGSSQGTHKDLKQAVEEGVFREDLYYRLNVVPIRVPSLRERPGDIALLVNVFTQRICEKSNLKPKTVDEDVVWELQRYSWPGNIRELQNILERMLIMSGERVSVRDREELAAG